MIKAAILNASPWRFQPGDDVHVRGWSQDQTVRILCQASLPVVLPHYYVMDGNGNEWRIAQVELSRKAIPAV